MKKGPPVEAIAGLSKGLSQGFFPLSQASIWVLTDGKAGDENQCLGVAEALGGPLVVKRVAPRRPWVWLMPWGPPDPREAPGVPGSPLQPPWPDILIASGRRTVPSVRAVKKASDGRVFCVFLKDPRVSARIADLVWAPAHDRIEGANVLKTLTSPHRVSAAVLAAARAAPRADLRALPHPRVAVLVGGDSRHYRFSQQNIADFAGGLDAIAASGASLMGSRSRRTPPALDAAAREAFARHGGWFWDGNGENPYIQMLANADYILVTADSVNMVGEAAATGVPVLVFDPDGGHRKIAAFLEAMRREGAVHKFAGRLEGERYTPLDSTPVIAAAIADGWQKRRRI